MHLLFGNVSSRVSTLNTLFLKMYLLVFPHSTHCSSKCVFPCFHTQHTAPQNVFSRASTLNTLFLKMCFPVFPHSTHRSSKCAFLCFHTQHTAPQNVSSRVSTLNTLLLKMCFPVFPHSTHCSSKCVFPCFHTHCSTKVLKIIFVGPTEGRIKLTSFAFDKLHADVLSALYKDVCQTSERSMMN